MTLTLKECFINALSEAATLLTPFMCVPLNNCMFVTINVRLNEINILNDAKNLAPLSISIFFWLKTDNFNFLVLFR